MSAIWLADIRRTESFTPDDEAFLARLQQIGGAASMLASQQRKRQEHIRIHGEDIIADQLRVFKEVFRKDMVQ